jgi:hypothetical protein
MMGMGKIDGTDYGINGRRRWMMDREKRDGS